MINTDPSFKLKIKRYNNFYVNYKLMAGISQESANRMKSNIKK